MWTASTFEDYPAVIGETDRMRVTVLPSLGAKTISILNRKTGREWLYRSDKPLGNKGYGSSFLDGDVSGWDEMFPAVNGGRFPVNPWLTLSNPDHGEVWSIPWNMEIKDNELSCSVRGIHLPYDLEKTYTFSSESGFRIDYRVNNLSDVAMPFLWAAHPLLNIREGMKILVPHDLEEITVSYSHHDRLGSFGERNSWPVAITADEQSTDLSTVGTMMEHSAEKFYFSNPLKEGWVALLDPYTNESFRLAFPVHQVPYLAIWADYGGYGAYHLALEPASGWMDDLEFAYGKGKTSILPPCGTYTWHLEVTI